MGDEDSVVWDDSYSVGHDGMDYQHKDLVKMTSELFDICKDGENADGIAFRIAINKAAAYAKIHFADEENHMRKANFPDMEKHKAEHEQFVATVAETLKKYEEGEAKPIEMARFLKNWLLNHIAKSDKQYSSYLAKL